MNARQTATTFGVLSAASGVAMLAMPSAMAALYGFPKSRTLLRALGARDLVIGVALVISGNPAPALWARAVSDGFDAVVILSDARRRGLLLSMVRTAVAAGSAVLAAKTARTLSRQWKGAYEDGSINA